MKLSIKTITITFEGVEFVAESTTRYSADTEQILPPLRKMTVAENDLNRENPFWNQQIGKTVTVLHDHGIYMDVQLDDQPVPSQGVDTARFT